LIRLRLFGRCRIYHDPVSPVLKAPAQIGWNAWFRDIDLVTPRALKGRELLMRTRGWWTVEPREVAAVVEAHGKLTVGDGGNSWWNWGTMKRWKPCRSPLRSISETRSCCAPEEIGSLVKPPESVRKG
jgi:hypothetical protein